MNQINHVKMNKQIISAGSPIGSITAYGGTVAPIGWHNCDGSPALLEDYPDFIQWAVENDAIGEGKLLEHVDGSDTFNFPDMRETVLVGCGHNGTHVFDSTETVPGTATPGTQNHDEYTIGQFKDDQFQGHDHSYYCASEPEGRTQDESLYGDTAKWQQTRDIWARPGCGNPRYGTTTHSKQIGVSYIIRVQ